MTDDLDALRRFRDEVANPSGTSWAVARAALTVAMHPERVRQPSTARRLRGRRWRPLALFAVLVLGGTTGALAATGTIDFGGPPPVPSRGGALIACPNPSGLEPFNSATKTRAVKIARTYGRISLTADLKHSDRAWWPEVRKMWRSRVPGKGVVTQESHSSEPAPNSAYSVIVRFSCGAKLVAKSLAVSIGPHQTHPPYSGDCISTLFFVNRRSRPLIYYDH